MKIKRKTHKALVEQREILMQITDRIEDYVVLFKDMEKLLVVLQNVLEGKFVELLVEHKVMSYYIDIILKRKSKIIDICPISSLIRGTFTWSGTCQGINFWCDIDNKLQYIIYQYYEDKKK